MARIRPFVVSYLPLPIVYSIFIVHNVQPQWETVPVEMVETPGDVFQSILEEGYQVDYLRIPMYVCSQDVDLIPLQCVTYSLYFFNYQYGRTGAYSGCV